MMPSESFWESETIRDSKQVVLITALDEVETKIRGIEPGPLMCIRRLCFLPVNRDCHTLFAERRDGI